MNTTIINKFIGKEVMIFISGISHIGYLMECPNEGIMILKPSNKDKKYGEMYIKTNSIDAIRECLLEPKREPECEILTDYDKFCNIIKECEEKTNNVMDKIDKLFDKDIKV